MTAKEYLSQIYELNRHINLLVNDVKALEELDGAVSAVNYEVERLGGTRNTKAPFIYHVEKKLELEGEIERLNRKLMELKVEVSMEIDKIADVNERVVLRSRYVNGKTWKEIANQINFSTRTVHRIHSTALQNFKVKK